MYACVISKALAFSEIYNRELCMGKRLFHFRKTPTDGGQTASEHSLCTKNNGIKRKKIHHNGKYAMNAFGGNDTNIQADVCVCEEGTCKNATGIRSLSGNDDAYMEKPVSSNEKEKNHKPPRMRHTIHVNKPNETDDWIAETGDTDWLDMDVIDTTFVEGHLDMLK